MTRTGDIAAPAITPHTVGADAPIASWRWRPIIGLEYLPQAPYVWDDDDQTVVWDAATLVWDAPFVGSGYTDAVCDFIALDLDPGEADELFLFPPVTATLTLDNRAGTYTPWSADGRLLYWAPGRRMSIIARRPDTGEQLWLFGGRVASWQVNADDTVTVVAYDGLSLLAQELGGNQTFGHTSDNVTARIIAITTAAAYPDRVDIDSGTVTLGQVTDAVSPLEAIQRVALSDGGIFYGDADGSIDYRNRNWRNGRTDQPTVWVVSDNICDAQVVIWDPELAADDERLATDVRLVNTAGTAANAALGSSLWASDARYVLTHPDPDLWQAPGDGQDLANYLLANQSTPSMAIDSFDLYVQDPVQFPAPWDLAVGSRRGDRIEVVHDYLDPDGDPGSLDLFAVVLGVHHAITPEEWVATFNLSRTVAYKPVQVLLWDRSPYTWDNTNPANVWRY